jgi:hypothetical protein
MSSFWPDGIEISDTQSPKDILNTAQEEWQTASDGILQLVLQDTKSESGNSMIIVHAKNVANNRTATLFSIVHQPEKPYPVTIQPEKEDLPVFLKKSYYRKTSEPSIPDALSLSMLNPTLSLQKGGGNGMEQVVNQWVSDTPPEFRKKLSEAFNLGIVRREILNLTSGNKNIANNINEDSIDHQDPS